MSAINIIPFFLTVPKLTKKRSKTAPHALAPEANGTYAYLTISVEREVSWNLPTTESLLLCQ